MRVVIENFGPVHHFEFSTDTSFHLIVGENNVGKSYALSAYYSILKAIDELNQTPSFFSFINTFLSLKENRNPSSSRPALNRSPKEDYRVQEYFEFVLKGLIDETVARWFSESIRGSYSEINSISNQFCGNKATIKVLMKDLEFVLRGDVDGFESEQVKYLHKVVVRPVRQNRSNIFQNDKYVIYQNVKEKEDIYGVIDRSCVFQFMTCFREFDRNIAEVHYLPASRSGLYQALSAFGQIVAQLSQSRSLLSSKIELPGISQQLSDYFIKLSNIVVAKDGYLEGVESIASSIEKDVLKGSIEFDESDKRIYYKPDNTDLKLDLSAASSMVSEVAPIVAYIRHIVARSDRPPQQRKRNKLPSQRVANKQQLLIIEEPEAHLHPINQIKMTSLYASLAKMGVKIVMTSHSNYVFNKLSNIVIAKELSVKEVACDLFAMTDLGGVGNPQGINELGIDDANFIDAGEFLLNEKLDLFSRLEE